MGVVLTMKTCLPDCFITMEKISKPENELPLRQPNNYKIMSKATIRREEHPSVRRRILLSTAASLVTVLTLNKGLTPLLVYAEEEEDQGIIGSFKSLFDPNSTTKKGKVLPKAYLNSAKELVKNLRESLNEDPVDNAKFRRNADSAKESIRDYLGNWGGQKIVAEEESYVELEKAIRTLAKFYSKAGPSASLPAEVKSEILDDLKIAEEYL